MKKIYTRIMACSLAVLIAFNTVVIPKSKAFVVESQLTSAIISTYLTASGFAFAGKGMAVGTPADMYIADRLDIFLRDFAEARQATKEEFEALILSGFELAQDGFVKISSSAATLLGQFSDWLIDKFGLIGEDGEPVSAPVGIVPSVGGLCLYNGVELPNINQVWTDKETYPYAVVFYLTLNGYYYVEFTNLPRNVDSNGLLVADSGTEHLLYINDGGIWTKNGSGAIGGFTQSGLTWSSYDVFRKDAGTMFLATSDPVASEDWENPLLYSVLSPDYEAAPTVDEQYVMVVDTGMTFADEQEYVNAILGAMANGELAPTYTIENAGGGDVVVPDEDTDTQTGILSWVKHIAQNVISLPQSIADKFAAFPQTIAEAVGKLFVPDATLTAEITDTFSAKFDFISDLHGLGVDLLNLDPEQTPPVIYIHLEDAESNYGYGYGGMTKALDMAWYERYKEDVDRIMSGFLWLGFLWLVFMRISDIINGAGMAYEITRPEIYDPGPSYAPRLEAPRWRRRGR